jgi:hypothetical protein
MRIFVDPKRLLRRFRLCGLAAVMLPAAALAEDFIVVPTDLQFGAIYVGETASIPVTIVNVSGVPQTPNYAGGAPNDPDNFGGSQNCAGVTLPPGGSCAFTYDFHPVSAGPQSSSTTIDIDATAYTITMAGTGLFPIAVGPLVLDFGSVRVGENATRIVLFMNISSVPQMPNYAGGAPFDPDNFGGSQNCAGVELPPTGSCTFTYEFHPVSAGFQLSSTTVDVDDESFSITMFGNAVGDEVFGNGFD